MVDEKQQLEQRILQFLERGWTLDMPSAQSNGCVYGPTGWVYEMGRLISHQCTICDDDHEEDVYLSHEETRIKEEDDARILMRLAKDYVFYYDCDLPKPRMRKR